jgi:ribonucleotide reductase alpha subunit
VLFYAEYYPDVIVSMNNHSAIVAFPVDLTDNYNDLHTKENTSAIQLLEFAALLQNYWVNTGHVIERQPVGFKATNNVSLTVNIKSHEWHQVGQHIVNNSDSYTGVSFLSATGDIDYEMAPFVAVWSLDRLRDEFKSVAPEEVKEVNQTLKSCFDSSLYLACRALESFEDDMNPFPHHRQLILRRVRLFIDKNFNSDVKHAIVCFKRYDTYFKFNRLQLELQMKEPLDWKQLIVDTKKHNENQAKSRSAIACSGSTSCVLKTL